MDKITRHPADYIVPLSIGGLEGRMLHIPAPPKAPETPQPTEEPSAAAAQAAEPAEPEAARAEPVTEPPKPKIMRDILFIYGHHSTLERWWGLMEVLSEYGSVTMPDLPGFGGMDSFYKVGRKPSIDSMADYLAAFIKWRYKRKKVTIVGMSFGFAVVTRMLQKYPELTRKVDLLISIVGFAHHNEFVFTRPRYLFYRSVAAVYAHNPAAWFFRYTALNSLMLRLVYGRTHNAKNKFAQATSKQDYKRLMDVEIILWQSNDVRTYMYTSSQMLTLDNTAKQVNLPVWHVSSQHDHFFDHTVIEQHLRGIYSEFHDAPTILPVHAPSVIADAEMAAPLVPDSLRAVLAGEIVA